MNHTSQKTSVTNPVITPVITIEKKYLNFSFYKFVELKNIETLQPKLKTLARELGIKGSILLSDEGINGFLCAPEDILWKFFRENILSIPELSDISPKESYSDHVPFTRMLVKIKKEIVTMGVPEIKPSLYTGKRVYPKELKEWLDQKENVVLIDTRNDYEIDLGTFEGAVEYGLKTFRQFPEKLKAHSQELQDKKVVMFCTGGIRCEKATALAMNYGIENVYQLEGGILKYFEEVGSDHYKGDCFVFDGREAVDPALTGTKDKRRLEVQHDLVLHSYRRCPFAIRVRTVLEEKKIPYLLIEEDLHHLSSAVLEHHPQKQVPLLFYKGVAYHQSSVIAEFLDEKFDFHEKQIANGEKQQLMPSTPEKRARVRQWSAWCDQVFKPDLDLYKYHYQRMPSDEQLALVERLHRYLNKIEGPLRRHPYIVGDTFGMADVYLFPFVRQLTMITTPVLPDLEKHEVLLTWLNGIMKRPSMDRVMGKQGEKPMDLSNPIASA